MTINLVISDLCTKKETVLAVTASIPMAVMYKCASRSYWNPAKQPTVAVYTITMVFSPPWRRI
jgi:hypothetical protein